MVFKTKVTLLRSDSGGLHKTIAKARHHAKELVPFIRILSSAIHAQAWQEWKQGDARHVLVASDGRQFKLRPLHHGGYVGVELVRMHNSRSSWTRPAVIMQARNTDQCIVMAQLLGILVLPETKNSPSITNE